MPLLALPALAPGTLSGVDQPSLPATDHLLLRPWRDDDASMVKDAFNCPNIQQWHVRSMDQLSEARAWIASCDALWQQETGASCRSGDTAAPGRRDRPVRNRRLGLEKRHLSQPCLADRTVVIECHDGPTVAVAEWAMHTVGFHRLSLTHSTRNTASCRVAEKAGFEAEGTMRGWGLHADGFHDGHLHARLRTGPRPSA